MAKPAAVRASPSAADSEETETESSRSMGSYHLDRLPSVGELAVVEEEKKLAPGELAMRNF